MKGANQIRKSSVRARTRDRKRTPRMHQSGKSVFTLSKLKDKK